MVVMRCTGTYTKEIRQAQKESKIHTKLNLKIICNTMEKNPYGQTSRDHPASGPVCGGPPHCRRDQRNNGFNFLEDVTAKSKKQRFSLEFMY
jgi:hypothetical protein